MGPESLLSAGEKGKVSFRQGIMPDITRDKTIENPDNPQKVIRAHLLLEIFL